MSESNFIVNDSMFAFKQLELSEWYCYLFGSDDFVFTPLEEGTPKLVLALDAILMFWKQVDKERSPPMSLNSDNYCTFPYAQKLMAAGIVMNQWGVNYQEFDPGNYSIGIVELPGGRIVIPTSDDVRFLEEAINGPTP